jgi:hypothetical protein
MSVLNFGSGLASIAQLIFGAHQYKQGMNMYNNTPFPNYNIPSEVSQNQSMAALMAMSGMPMEQYNIAKNNIGESQQFGLNAIKTRGGSIADVNALVGETNKATGNLDAVNAQQKIANEQGLMKANDVMAQYQDKSYDINRLQRYLMRMGIASQLMQGGGSNISGGFNNLAMLGESANENSGSGGGGGGGLSGLFSGGGTEGTLPIAAMAMA